MCNIKSAVNLIGGQTKTGNLLGVPQQSVWDWINKYQQAPAKYIPAISELTNNEVTVEQLLSDHVTNASKKVGNHAG